MNIEHRTPNIECWMGKRWRSRSGWYWIFVFHSMFDVRCSMLDVHLLEQFRMA